MHPIVAAMLVVFLSAFGTIPVPFAVTDCDTNIDMLVARGLSATARSSIDVHVGGLTNSPILRFATSYNGSDLEGTTNSPALRPATFYNESGLDEATTNTPTLPRTTTFNERDREYYEIAWGRFVDPEERSQGALCYSHSSKLQATCKDGGQSCHHACCVAMRRCHQHEDSEELIRRDRAWSGLWKTGS
ncbi:hypothetical protein B0H63DRAFT_167341 [Podospora didyma]|uniref:Secreted protein n=1 Tax=Podospora didyma TaxID=330526 RepID=A0AAE0NUH5_9PEZI|nr:hypothetical protein B0H63DRAFT_167341 [Podospora didyma]